MLSKASERSERAFGIGEHSIRSYVPYRLRDGWTNLAETWWMVEGMCENDLAKEFF